MGLDQYALTKSEDGEVLDKDFFYWRKHPDLHGWMQDLYTSRGGDKVFNCVELELFPEDIDALEEAVTGNDLPRTGGFFFGTSQPGYKEKTLEFIAKARKAFARGERVFYDSWW